MSKKFDKFKDGFLQDLSNVTDEKTESIKNSIGIKNNTTVNVKPSWFIMHKKPITWALSSLMACLIIIVTIVSVVNYQNTPVYKEMIATNIQTAPKLSSKVKRANSNFQDDVLDEIGVITLPNVSCYANPEEEIIITVKINNPKSFEIMSFTLNGYKYQSYEFEYGSNSNQILVKFKTTNISGIQNVTIDAIKYIEGDRIKDARFGGNKTIKIGVTYQNAPTATLSVTSQLTDGFADIEITDLDNLLDPTTGASLYVFDEEKLARRDNLIIGSIAANYFPHLKLGTKYTFMVVGVYDLLDGKGKKGVVLATQELLTEEGYTYGDLTKNYEQVEINLNKTNNFNGTLVESKLYHNDELVTTITLNQTDTKLLFEDLLSNNTYKVVTSYEYLTNQNDPSSKVIKEIETEFTTDLRPMPTLEITEQTPTKDGINFNHIITDTTDLGKVIKVEVVHLVNEQEIITEGKIYNEDVKTITGLLSNNDYKLYLTYQYDLKDGNGSQTFVVDYTFKTLEKSKPVITFKDITPEKKSINFNYDLVDLDQTGTILSVDLIKNEETVKTITDLTKLQFNELLSDNDYILSINYQYNLNDGQGDITETIKENVHTKPLVKPSVSVNAGPSFMNMLYATCYIEDPESIITIISFDLYKGETLISQTTEFKIDDNKVELMFSDLEIGEYTIVVVYEFDMNDGEGIIKYDFNNHPDDPSETNTCIGEVN